jgi:hypothetical protein
MRLLYVWRAVAASAGSGLDTQVDHLQARGRGKYSVPLLQRLDYQWLCPTG